MKKILKNSGVAVSLALVPALSSAEMYWSDNSITVLHGSDYYNVSHAFGDPNKDLEITTLTLEHASGHDWGDVFFFMDRHHGKGAAGDFNETYAELSPRLSLSNLTGQTLSVGPMKDVFLAMTYEMGSTSTGFSQDNYLYGIGFSWDVPGFAFLKTNISYSVNDNVKDDIQLNVGYGVPFSLGEVDFMFDGYIDWSSAESDHASDFHFNPQLRVDVGKFVGITKSKLEVGFEYSYWNNKYGVKSSDTESAFSAIMKYHL
ncbi:nucleoside-specific channel-forming protein, Tsx [Oleiphilus messinensis]|uniref:Nucleoside-specific channel-forming protein, Tsx n=1 Tax=Oleiphilus messinensis TaxID=141451 RepID=A0A1Y0IEC4_9GAMM|nr:DUF5020 family protein [Oleiphilus messinensis]ARU57724.1 nucleoside-specific channel-forming protein, Tsx [Oleiphilus messinensis]